MIGKYLAGLGVAAVLGLSAGQASAAPLGASPAAGVIPDASAVEPVARRCWRHRGHWHCRHTTRRWRHYGYGPGYYGYGPGYYGYGPGFGLYFGGGHRHHHGHHHHHRHHRHW